MRRILLLAIGALALAIAAPSVASAHGRHHGHHHHKHKAKHARVEHFGGNNASADPAGPAGPGDAGTVASYDQTTGLLTLTLADGSTVSGKVTADTTIGCVASGAPTATASHHGDWGDDDQGDDHDGGRCGGTSACDASDLVTGAVVHEAVLKLGSNGAEFKLVLLVKQASV